ncbi:hypothetical protein EUX98_g3379 [Antrodiella citrinella]|uniref:Auxin efflux carrier n=1 Tax=Antrodiella citrinella TaxID=2447956 RepID=A0A4S4MWP6_9APHY|nr:hypothetical protein EUX98_g3379 [Antrodiella citrinella]
MVNSLVGSFVGALQGTVSILLTLLAGYYIARCDYLDRNTVKRLSTLSTSIFLPCLIIVQMGPQLTTSNLSRLWIIPLWGLVSTIIAHLLGWLGQSLLKMPYWTIVASGRPNATALPLLLLQSLQYTGVLEELSAPGESVSDTLSRAKSLLLLNVIVQQAITFQSAPFVLNHDKKTKDDDERDEEDGSRPSRLAPGTGSHLPVAVQDMEHVGLLQEHRSYGTMQDETAGVADALGPIANQPDVHWPTRLRFAERPLKKVGSSMSPPLIAAIIALLVGIIPPFHQAILSKHGVLYGSLTQSLQNLGDLFVVLQTVAVGAELALVPRAHPGWMPGSYAIAVRFIFMPAISLLFVATTAGRGWYVDDKLVWFLLVLIPAGPSAMLLASVAEIVNVDQGPIAGYLLISYLLSPVMAVICSAALKVVEVASR